MISACTKNKMIQLKILLFAGLTTFVFSQQYRSTAEKLTTSILSSNTNDAKVTEAPYQYFENNFYKQVTNSLAKESTQKNEKNAEKNSFEQKQIKTTEPVLSIVRQTTQPMFEGLPDHFYETPDSVVEIDEDDNSYLNLNDMPSISSEHKKAVTNVNSLDDTVNQSTRSGKNPSSTTTTSTASITQYPLVTLMPSTHISIKSTIAPRVKMGKTIKTYKSSADQVLRQFVENEYLRQPIACIIDTTENNLRKAQMLWNATLRSNTPLDILLSGYNSTGDLFYIYCDTLLYL